MRCNQIFSFVIVYYSSKIILPPGFNEKNVLHFSSIISEGATQGFGLDVRRDMSEGKKIESRRKE